MLCDEIAATDRSVIRRSMVTTGAPDGGALATSYLEKTYGWWTAELRESQRFMLDDTVALTIQHVASGRPSSILAARDYIRLPYEQCWFEWADTARTKARHSPSPILAAVRLFPAKRVGFLCRQESDNEISIQLAWSGHDKREIVQTSPLTMVLDRRKTREISATDAQLHALRPDVAQSEFAALRLLDSWWDMGCSSFHAMAYPPDLRAAFQQRVIEKQQIYETDWAGEGSFFCALLIMLNTKNGVALETSNLAVLNKSRLRSGKRSLLDHQIVQLRHHRETRRGNVHGDGGSVARAHLVRGHFKVRQSGVFWWSPFVRGDSSRGVMTHEYRMRD